MHGNAGNKMEGLDYSHVLIPKGIDLCTFDFSGCGNSQGDFVTLGWKEVHDLHAVLCHLKSQGRTTDVVLWGRSMGAATALMYNE
jgi:alpha/beta superfamily hydrolase